MTAQGLAAGTVIGRYEISKPLGAGGMGEVYAARDRTLDRIIALKILPGSLTADPRRLERFTLEAKAASALNHPTIVTVHEIGQARPDGTGEAINFIAMELVDGETLSDWLIRSPSIDEILTTLAAIARGIGRVHARGIVHRDLKPENIMMTADGQPKILDFGVAKLVEPDAIERSDEPTPACSGTLTQPMTLLGTIGYMSPEQIEGSRLDHRSDIFSLGCILYECLANRHPFASATCAETLHRIVNVEPEPVTLAEPSCSEAVLRILRRCLAKDRESRYDSAVDLALDLEEAATDSAVARVALRPSGSRLRRTILTLVAAVVLIGIPATALVDSARGKNLLEQLMTERRRADQLSTKIEQQTTQLNDKDRELEQLRTQSQIEAARRDELEDSYRNFVVDMTRDIRGNESERNQLRVRLDQAEGELNAFREAEAGQQRIEDLRNLKADLTRFTTVTGDAKSVTALVPGSSFRQADSSPAFNVQFLVARVADNLVRYPKMNVRIEGHADSNGDAAGNLILSKQRADSIRDLLVAAGVDAGRITTAGYGELRPLVSNDTQTGRMVNRRVELTFSY